MAGLAKQNKHLEHLEDDIINLGYKGAQQSIAFVEALLQLFEGNSNTGVNVTVKWDGAPAVVCGKDPETGLFFVATKHGAFAKNMKLGFTEAMIDFYYEGKAGLINTLKHVYRELKDLGMTEVLQGDVMFTSEKKKIQIINGEEYLTFKPNTIVYAVPSKDPLAEKMKNSNLGIVFHTKYLGTGPVNTLSASFGVDTSRLKSRTAWIEDATYKDLSGKMTLTAQETRTVSTKLASAKTNAITIRKFLDELSMQTTDLSVGYMFKIFVNQLVRANTPITQRSLAGLEPFIIERINKKEAGVKTGKGKQRYIGLKKEIQEYLRANSANLRTMFSLYEGLLMMKNILVKKLNGAQSIPTFIETEKGFKITDPEGFVAIDKEGNAVKLVNRMEFSTANFNAVKDWTTPAAAPVETTQKLKTMVFAFGRMNPPTIGHEKLIKKVVETARVEQGDYVIVLSKTQKSPKDPLDPDTKLVFAKKMFPRVNLQLATTQMPTFFGWLKKFYEEKYDKVIMIGGSDRVREYQDLLNKYNGQPSQYTFKVLEALSAGERDPDADGAAGMSASKMREYAKNNDYTNFKKGIPNTLRAADVQLLMAAIQAEME